MCRHGDCNWDTSEGGLSASSPTRAQKLPCSPGVYTHPNVICRKFHRWSPFNETCTAIKCPRERGTEYQKGKRHRVSKEQTRCNLACSREWPCAEDPRRDIFPSDCHGLLPRRLPPPCAPPLAHAAVTPPPTMAKLKPHSRPALPGIVSSQNSTNLGAITRNYPEWGWSALE